ncbi:MAG: DMT family transporter [Oligoflexia bacterium]|nr:DMT family transporter [Oligoflexia bacterium]
MFLVILLYALFGSLFVISKGTLKFAGPFFFIGSRMMFAGVLLLAYQAIVARKSLVINIKQLGYMALLGVVNIYLTNIFEIWGLQHMVSAKACLIYSLSPFLSAIIAFFALKETLSVKKWVGLFVGLLGSVPIFTAQTMLPGHFSGAYYGAPELALLVAVACSVCGWILLKKIVNDLKCTPVLANGVSMFVGGGMALIHSYVSGEYWTPVPVTSPSNFIQYSLAMCLISNIICYNLYGHLLRFYSATFMSFAGLITPVFASLFGWYFLEEPVSWNYLISIIIFSIGLFIFYQEEIKDNYSARNHQYLSET